MAAYTDEASFEASSGLGVGAASTDILTTAEFTLLEAKARAYINAQLGITADLTSPSLNVEDAANLRIKAMVLNAQAAADTTSSGGDILIQELQIKGAVNASAEMRTIARGCQSEALALLNLEAASGGDILVSKGVW